MKPLVCLLLTLAVSASALAGPLQKEIVSADTKWLLHLDLDNFKSTKLGGFVNREIIATNIAQYRMAIQVAFKIDLDWEKISSITAYGTDYGAKSGGSGVLLIKTSLDIQKALDLLAPNIAPSGGKGEVGAGADKGAGKSGDADIAATLNGAAGAGGGVGLKKLQATPFPIYSVNNELRIAILPNNLVLAAKSDDLIQKAASVVSGKAANLRSSKSASLFDGSPTAFFFMAAAEAFNANTPLPAQAQVLKMADGGRLVLGEAANQLYLNLGLQAKTPEMASSTQQLIQGMMALLALGQADNKELLQLLQAVKISSAEKIVSFNVEYPVDKAIEAVRLEIAKTGHAPTAVTGVAKKKAKQKKAAVADPDAETPEKPADK